MNWEAKSVVHRGEKRIAIYFEKNQEWIARIKKIEGARWSATLRAWHVPDTLQNRALFKVADPEPGMSQEAVKQIELFRQWLHTKRYSENTLKTYSEALKSFLLFFKHKPIEEITNNDVITYNYEFIVKNKLSASYQNQVINAIKLYFATLQNRKIETDKIERPRKETHLPNVLSKEEVKAILDAPTNLKHKAMLTVIYSCGLRRSELLNLKN
ncbi:MAG: tyrosine-type recombinase/integrase, partial [Flammeovirgaceae bacterium]